MHSGEVALIGEPHAAVAGYLSQHETHQSCTYGAADGPLQIIGVRLTNSAGRSTSIVQSGQELAIHLRYMAEAGHRFDDLNVGIIVSTPFGERLFSHSNRIAGQPLGEVPTIGVFVCQIAELPLAPGNYMLGFAIKVLGNYSHLQTAAIPFTVVEGDYYGTGQVYSRGAGYFLVRADWYVQT
jgi:hypothetical protein